MTFSYSELAARSQAIGSHFSPLSTDHAEAAALLRGELTLKPHRLWRLPESPKWNENPFREVNWVAQLHMLRWLDPLRRRADAGDPSGVDLWVATVTSWIEANPPGRGRATYSWGDMVEAVRAMIMCFGLPMLTEHRPEALTVVLRSIEEHGRWLEDPKHVRKGNHALQQHQGLLVIGAVLEHEEWVDLAVERMTAMLKTSYDEEGINEEGAVQYHQINYSWWSLTKRRVELVRGAAPAEFRRIERAPLALAHATRPDGTYELIGDTEVFSLRGIPHPAVEFVASGGREGAPPPERVKTYASGYVFGRSGWGDDDRPFSEHTFYSLRFGPQNRIHGHVDGGSLTLFHRGAPVLVDGGKYAYDAVDPFRAHVLSRAAHNSVVVDGVEYDRTAEVTLTRSEIREGGEDFELLDRGYAGVEIRRRVLVLWDLEAIVVIDDVTAEDPVTAAQVWHLEPSAGHRKEGAVVLSAQATTKTWFAPVGEAPEVSVVKGRTDPWQGWTSYRWREKTPTRTVLMAKTGNRLRLQTLIDFSGADSAPEVTLHDNVAGTAAHVVSWTRPGQPVRSVAVGPGWFSRDSRGSSPDALVRLGTDSFGVGPP
ncbi:heparinase II/III family protein [Knoellia sp. S7-12]|uniref:heparinase II/III domain-containing protein n=1 Tax=Knoellia sp. S7-12 TaxID=3126698 RepID=UPI00336945A7